MALRGLAYSVRMAAYNADGARVSGIASTITATLWSDGTTTVLSDITITEIGNTGVYVIPLTAAQMAAYNLCITAVSSTAGITFDPVYLDTDAGRVDVATSTRLATSGYTTPPTVNEIQNGLAMSDDIPTVEEIQSGLATASELTSATSAIREDVATVGSEVSTVDSVVDSIALRMPSSGTVATIGDLPIPPTTTAIADAVVPRVLGTSINTVTDVAVGSLGTLILGRLSSRIDGNEQVIYQLDGMTEHTRLTIVPATEDIPDIAGMLPDDGSSSV